MRACGQDERWSKTPTGKPIPRCSCRSLIRPSTTAPTAPRTLARILIMPPNAALGRSAGHERTTTDPSGTLSIWSQRRRAMSELELGSNSNSATHVVRLHFRLRVGQASILNRVGAPDDLGVALLAPRTPHRRTGDEAARGVGRDFEERVRDVACRVRREGGHDRGGGEGEHGVGSE